MSGFFTSPRIAWGTGAIEQLSGLEARKASVIVDPNVAGGEGFRRIVEELQKSDTIVEVVTADPGVPHVANAQTLARRLATFGPDWIVAVGGGSTVDLAKVARALHERPELAPEGLNPLTDLPSPPRARLVAAPTTSGRGSEASWSATVLNAEGDPVEPMHRGFVPDWALVDPALARSMPWDVALDAGVEALGHAIEAYVSAWSNPFSDALALDAAMGAFQALPALERWDNADAFRARLHYSATAAGLAASNAQLGVAHALANALLEPTGLPYGRLFGVALVPALDFNYASARDRYATLGAYLATTDSRAPSDPRASARLSESIGAVFDRLHFPRSLERAGASRKSVDESRARVVRRVGRSTATLANPRVPTAEDVERLLDTMLGDGADGGRT